ncbi:methionine ABC transporter ATP-binding protein [Cellulomonas sp. WB94]|uniref:methionine ABC transporter ATP-binding protein n=1 Tax=Cellulomonas sp. WB94 TaxID=2173174 RepID=UPI000D57C652|nr:ATP-binding cassette domain-containing protein [Cellulomonas sp. WB94]PVU83132.1 methionine ABC transporter ATP-binding protein [Cellulomonas sp. WB94]
MSTAPRIQVIGLRKVYPGAGRDVVALDGIDVSVQPGEIHGIVGRSGAGKSTLIRCLTVLERPTSGSVVVDGEELSALPEARLRAARRRIGLVFQHVNLLDSRTVAGNVAYPLEVAGVPRAARAARVAELLDLVGLGERADAYPAQLSGGQKQRVGIARALATEPAVLLCDEPTSALDSATTRQILGLIRDLRDRLGITVLIITHEMAVVREICDTVTLLDHGRVAEHGPVGEVVAAYGSRLARELIPVPTQPLGDERTLVEVAYTTGDVPTHQVLAAVASLGTGVELAAGTIETLAGRRVGRLRLDVPAGEVDRALEALRAAGVHAEVAAGPDVEPDDDAADDEEVAS